MEKLLILTYHAVDSRSSVTSVTPALFQKQMEMLDDKGLRGISLSEAFDHADQTGRYPDDAVVLTFDDGYRSLIQNVLPVTRSLGFTGTVFVVPDMIEMDAKQTRIVNMDLDRDLLNWQQIETLLGSGFEIGSHTRKHPRLTQLSINEVEEELGGSRKLLQQRLQIPINAIAYPYGSFNPLVRETASRYYRYGCTTLLGRCDMEIDRLLLKRVDVYYLRNARTFSSVCDGELEAYLRFRQYLRNLKQKTIDFLD